MEASTLRRLARLFFLLLWVPFCQSLHPPSPSSLCRRPRLEESIFVQENQCPLDELHTELFTRRGVLEVNGSALERSLRLLNTRDSMYAAVLVYARWCPFSRALLPVFYSLASTFPFVYHFAVEETALQPSAFSYYGVHSFPVLILHNKTAKVRYQGSRTYEAIAEFYKEVSGFQPVTYHYEIADRGKSSKRGELELSARLSENGKMHDDLYLTFSFIFLFLRVLFYLLPRFLKAVKQYWVQKNLSWQGHRSLLRRVVFGNFEQKRASNAASKSYKGKSPKMDFTQETGKALLSVPGWPSSSLAAVSLAEGSSSKTGAKEDVHDNGHVFKNYLWP
eukprot:c7718_g1_i1 orf=301-1305(+)